MKHKKILIVGVSCSGKTTLGRQLEQKLGIPMTDMDDLYWLPGWQRRDTSELIELVDQVTQRESWILSGECRETRDMLFSRADLVIWLDSPLPVLLWRGVRRAFRLAWNKTPICNGNYASLGRLFHRESIIRFILKGYRKKRPCYLALLAQEPPFEMLRFRSQEIAEIYKMFC